jgi:hypothetical protein
VKKRQKARKTIKIIVIENYSGVMYNNINIVEKMTIN